MKKLLFTLEVLFMLSVLPFFLGMAMSRKYHVNNEIQKEISRQGIYVNSNVYVSFPGALKNS